MGEQAGRSPQREHLLMGQGHMELKNDRLTSSFVTLSVLHGFGHAYGEL